MKQAAFIFLLTTFASAAEPPKQQTAYITVTPPAPTTGELPAPASADSINVIGMINSPQAVKVDREISVLDAIVAAGGLNRLSSRTEFTISGLNGTVVWRGPSFTSEEGKVLYSRIMIRAGEVLYIPELCRF